GDQRALIAELRMEPGHLVAQRDAPPLGLPHLLGGNGHGEDDERGGEMPAPVRTRHDASIRHERSPGGGITVRYSTTFRAAILNSGQHWPSGRAAPRAP